MKIRTYELLEDLHGKFGAQEFGKICQKLLAIAFQKAGYKHIVERGVQGVDIDAAKNNEEKYAIEVKTTTKDTVKFGIKDKESLQERAKDGYKPILAILHLAILSEWYFVKADKIKPKTNLSIVLLRPYRLRDLEESISPFFNEAVEEHFEGTKMMGQEYLNSVLKRKGIEIED